MINQTNFTSHDVEIQKLFDVSYSERRQELYITDFNDNQLFTIQLYEIDEEMKADIMRESQHEYFDKQAVYYYYKDEIIDLIDAIYPNLNIDFKTFDIINFKSSQDSLYIVGLLDYTKYLTFAYDEDEALQNVYEFIEDLEGIDTSEEGFFQTVFKIE
jgi:hypothetical protein